MLVGKIEPWEKETLEFVQRMIIQIRNDETFTYDLTDCGGIEIFNSKQESVYCNVCSADFIDVIMKFMFGVPRVERGCEREFKKVYSEEQWDEEKKGLCYKQFE